MLAKYIRADYSSRATNVLSPEATQVMAVTLSLMALLVLIGVFLFLRRNKSVGTAQRPPMQRPAASQTSSAFHAVSIKFGSNACPAARTMAGKRFLSGAAPRIPLPDCNVLECKCRFVHHKDRRAGDDRRSLFGQGMASSTGTHPKEQRQGEDRRGDDSDGFF
jgi:hypothetical protein